MEVTDELREHVPKRFARVARQVSELASLEVELREERNPAIPDRYVAEANLHLKGVTLHAEEASPEMLHSIHELAEDIRRQVKRHREKRRAQRAARSAPAPGDPPSAGDADAGVRAPPGASRRSSGNPSVRSIPMAGRGMIDRALRVGEGRKFKEYEKRVDDDQPLRARDGAARRRRDPRARRRAARARPRGRRVARRPASRGVRALPRGGRSARSASATTTSS